jgi:3-oxoacyl-[acyl-carrier-protein] synthase II
VTPRVVTGVGVVSAIGLGKDAFREVLATGAAPTNRAITTFDAAPYPDALVAEVPDFDAARFLGDKGLRSLDRQTKLLVVAARLCLQDAALKKDNAFIALGPTRVGLCAANAYGSLEAIVELDRVAVLEDPRYVNPAKFPNTVANSANGYVSIWEDVRALNVAVSDGNCGALDTLACADVYLETGRADAILVGGSEAMSEGLYLAFARLRGLTKGMLLGEGAALFVLETAESAKERGARVDARVLGTGTSYVAPVREGALLHASPEAMGRAVANALTDAGIAADEVDLVVSGVSRSGAFADAELTGIGRTLGTDVAIAAPKSLLGETLGASGAMGMAAAIAWLGGTPVTTLLKGAAPAKVRTVVVTTLGYYGNATAAVLRQA